MFNAQTLNNRELATAVWFLVFAVFALRIRSVRDSVKRLIRVSLHWKIFFYFGCAALYTAVVAAILWIAGLWKASLVKDTIFWFCFSGIGMITRFLTSRADESIIRKLVIDNIKVLILIEFLVSEYTLPFIGEFFLVPFLVILVLVEQVASFDEKNATVTQLLRYLLAIIGIAIVSYAIFKAIGDYRKVGTIDTLRKLALAPILSLASAPFIYLLLLVSKYKSVFIRLDIGPEKPAVVKRYARRRIVSQFKMRLKDLRMFERDRGLRLCGVQTKDDVDGLFRIDDATLSVPDDSDLTNAVNV